jgi:hypothetical protein
MLALASSLLKSIAVVRAPGPAKLSVKPSRLLPGPLIDQAQ